MKIVNYSKLRPNNILSKQFSHLLLLVFWIIYGLAFEFVESLSLNYTVIYHPLDEKIPFCEIFSIPYYFWFAYIVVTLLYTGFFDVPSFKKYMWFIIITYSLTLIFYLIFPNKQELRPTEFLRDNIFTKIVAATYTIDTNTNVFPSIHVIGGIASLFAFWHSKHFSTFVWRLINTIITILICLSTVFMKQHSVLDIVGGVVVCLIFYPIIYKTLPKNEVYPYYIETKSSKEHVQKRKTQP